MIKLSWNRNQKGEFRKVIKKFIKTLVIIIVVFGIPFALNYLFFPLKTECDNDWNIAGNQINLEVKGFSLDARLQGIIERNFLHIPSELKLYDMHIIINSPSKNCNFNDEFSVFTIKNFNPEKYLKSSLKKSEICTNPDANVWRIPNGRGKFTFAPGDTLDMVIVFVWENCESDKLDLKKIIEFCATQNKETWILKYILIFIIWITVFSSLINVFRLLRNWINRNPDPKHKRSLRR